jgi:hypothetical protein
MLPTSTNEILKSPIPVVSVLTDVVNLSSNTFDEALDFTIGVVSDEKRRDPSNWTSGEWDKVDRKEKLYYTKRLFPISKPFWDFMDALVRDEEDIIRDRELAKKRAELKKRRSNDFSFSF